MAGFAPTQLTDELILPVLIVAIYLTVVVVCMVTDADLVRNANRSGLSLSSLFVPYLTCSGYIALAQLPVVFLFATKNSLLSLLLGPGYGYEKLNYIHKWSGRAIFLASVIHGALWIQDHLKNDLPILGEIKEVTGVAGFALLCIMILISVRPVRRKIYEIFYLIQ